MNVSVEVHSVPFWKLAIRDPLTLGTLILMATACSIQVVAIGAVFWSRAHFGSQFKSEVYDDYVRADSDEAIIVNLRQREIKRARDEAMQAPSQEQVALILRRASDELSQARSRANEVQIVTGESEKQTVQIMTLAEEAWKRGDRPEAIRQLQLAVQATPSYLPAMKMLALYYEENGQFEPARFQWEKILGMASPDSENAKEAQTRIEQLALKPKETVVATATPAVVETATAPNTISLLTVDRTDLPTEERFDLRYNLRFTLNARGSEPAMDISQAKVEVTFYDQTLSATGTPVPLKVLSTVLQPKAPWPTGTQWVTSLNYSVPRGYFKKRAKVFGDSYRFCGYVVRVFYRQELQDFRAEPRDPLEVFARRTATAADPTP